MAAAAPFFQAIGAALTATFGAAGVALIKAILINVALGKLSKLLTREPRAEVPPVNITVRTSVENRRIVFGSPRCGGAIVFQDIATGGNAGELWYVVVYAGHQCEAIRGVWLDKRFVPASEINGGAAAGGAVTTGVFANVLWIYKHLGTSAQAADTELNNAFSDWTSDHKLLGCAYIALRMKRDDEKWAAGAPTDVTAEMDGALCYDPRLDSTVPGGAGSHLKTDPSTWAFTRCPPLHWRWYRTGGSVHNDTTTRLIKYGVRDADSRIPDAYVIAAANKSDETLSGAVAPPSGSQPRYRCDLEVSTGEPRREIIEAILATMAGEDVTVSGKLRIYAGSYATPLHTITDDDLYGRLEVEDTADHRRRYNAVAGVFRDAANQYIEQTTIFRTDPAYVTQDNDKEIPIELDLRGVTSGEQAQRLAEIKLRRSRMMRAVKLVGALNLLKVALREGISFTAAAPGWSNRIFRSAERQLEFGEEAGRVSLTCERDDPGVWADLLTADYETGTSATDVFIADTPAAPTGLTTTGIPGAVLISVTLPATITPGSVVEIWEFTANTPFASAIKVAEGRGNIFSVSHRDTTARFYWATIMDARKARSTEFPSGNGTSGTPDRVQTVDINPDAATEVYSSDSPGGNIFVQTEAGGGAVSGAIQSAIFTLPVDATIRVTAVFEGYFTESVNGDVTVARARAFVHENVLGGPNWQGGSYIEVPEGSASPGNKTPITVVAQFNVSANVAYAAGLWFELTSSAAAAELHAISPNAIVEGILR